jgi:hypothetical protein
MKKLLYVLLACLVLLTMVSVVSAATEIKAFIYANPDVVYEGFPVHFTGSTQGVQYQGALTGSTINIYQSPFPSKIFVRGLGPKLIGSTTVNFRGYWSFDYYPTKTAWYYAKCIPKNPEFTTSKFINWQRVKVIGRPIPA